MKYSRSSAGVTQIDKSYESRGAQMRWIESGLESRLDQSFRWFIQKERMDEQRKAITVLMTEESRRWV